MKICNMEKKQIWKFHVPLSLFVLHKQISGHCLKEYGDNSWRLTLDLVKF